MPGSRRLGRGLLMSCNDIAIEVKNLAKYYQIYDEPGDRLKQFLIPKLATLFGLKSKKYFREFKALDDISFKIKKGETVGIIGRNGSGKSTLLQLICGTLHPTHGEVQVNGRVAALLELGSGFNPEFTGRENAYLNAAVLGLTPEQIDSRFSQIVEFADIGDFIDQPVKTYSSGMMVRLAFAVIAHVDADILVIDEALAVGDAFFTQKCMRYLRKFMESGTVLFVSHDSLSVQSLCNYAYWIGAGSIIKHGTPKKVCESYLENLYESHQGTEKTTKHFVPQRVENEVDQEFKDQRIDFINNSNLRNDLHVFKFDPSSNSFGLMDAQIIDIKFIDKLGNPLAFIVGGEKVSLEILVEAHKDISSPIIGFFVKDRLGQPLFGDNTYLSYKNSDISLRSKCLIKSSFTFYMPILPAGDYSITVAVASGTQEDHIQHHWIHDALTFACATSSVAHGLVGIPMLDINLSVIK